jgi:phytoene/squalene synthetase
MGTALPSDEMLVAMWHGSQTADRIADEAHMPLAELYRQWRRLKYEERIPNRPRIPARQSYRVPENKVVSVRGPALSDVDGRPTVGSDPLLEALQREHRNRPT